MNVIAAKKPGRHSQRTVGVTEPLPGASLSIGAGFEATSFRARDIGELMDPLVMVDHYVMTEPTFGAHPHAGLSAVSLLFEDSEGRFHNRDSLGNDFDLRPGDLYWLKAGSGAVHDEYPRVNARTHGLQVFVNMPDAQRYEAPESLLVRASDMPLINTASYRVKVALGASNGVTGAISPSIPMTILDGIIKSGGSFSHNSVPNRGIWVQAIDGNLEVIVGGAVRVLAQGQSIAIGASEATEVRLLNPSRNDAQFVLFDGQYIGETYVQDGPFVMGSTEQIANIKAAHAAGRLGQVSGKP